MAAAKRKLVFDSPNESSVNFETSPNFPKEVCGIKYVDKNSNYICFHRNC